MQAVQARHLIDLEEGHREGDEVLRAEEVAEEETTDDEQVVFRKGERSKRDKTVVGGLIDNERGGKTANRVGRYDYRLALPLYDGSPGGTVDLGTSPRALWRRSVAVQGGPKSRTRKALIWRRSDPKAAIEELKLTWFFGVIILHSR